MLREENFVSQPTRRCLKGNESFSRGPQSPAQAAPSLQSVNFPSSPRHFPFSFVNWKSPHLRVADVRAKGVAPARTLMPSYRLSRWWIPTLGLLGMLIGLWL